MIWVHTLFFAGIFSLCLFGWHFQDMLLILITVLSIEAIYLALFIQMTVNRASETIEDVEEYIDDIEHDIDIIQLEDKKTKCMTRGWLRH